VSTVSVPDPEVVAAFAAQIDDAARRANDANDVLTHLVLPDRYSELWSVARAFSYLAHLPEDGKPKPFFGPWTMTPDGSPVPPPLAEIPEDDAVLWQAVACAVSSPVASALLNDVCFEARWGNGRDHARKAVEGYLAMAATTDASVEVGVVGRSPRGTRRPAWRRGRVWSVTIRGLRLSAVSPSPPPEAGRGHEPHREPDVHP
jgi:hypothetical protein